MTCRQYCQYQNIADVFHSFYLYLWPYPELVLSILLHCHGALKIMLIMLCKSQIIEQVNVSPKKTFTLAKTSTWRSCPSVSVFRRALTSFAHRPSMSHRKTLGFWFLHEQVVELEEPVSYCIGQSCFCVCSLTLLPPARVLRNPPDV